MNYKSHFAAFLVLFIFTTGHCQLSLSAAKSVAAKYKLHSYSYHEKFEGHNDYAAPIILTQNGGTVFFSDSISNASRGIIKLSRDSKVEWEIAIAPKHDEYETQSIIQDREGNYYAFMLSYNRKIYRGGSERVIYIGNDGTILWDIILGDYGIVNSPLCSFIRLTEKNQLELRGHIVTKDPEKDRWGYYIDPEYHQWTGWLKKDGSYLQSIGDIIDWANKDWKKFIEIQDTSVANAQTETAKQPNCDEIEGLQIEDYDFLHTIIPEDYTGVTFKCSSIHEVLWVCNYKDGKKDGLYRRWHDNGQLEYEGNYKEGGRDGLWRVWYWNGQQLNESNNKDGKKDGLMRVWMINGQLKREHNYKDGKLDGLIRRWHDNGLLAYEGQFKEGKKDGRCKFYYENGSLKELGEHKWNKKIGIWRYYHKIAVKKEQRSKKEVYTKIGDGKLISQKCWDKNGKKTDCE